MIPENYPQITQITQIYNKNSKARFVLLNLRNLCNLRIKKKGNEQVLIPLNHS
jgi:hypothetical protein